MITIITDGAAKDVAQDMYNSIAKTRQDIKYFNMENMRVEPCYGCRGCEDKTFGRCIIRDDADVLLPCLIRSKTIVIFTPIIFGGYSFATKRIADRFLLMIPKRYHFNNGELVCGINPEVNYYVIGVNDGVDAQETQVFKQLVKETHIIVGWAGQSFVLPYDADEYNQLVRKVAEI